VALLAALSLVAATAGSPLQAATPRAAPPRPATGVREVPLPPPSYYRPIMVDGMTFPVARTNWLSVVSFQNDWHEPRLRLIGGKWRLVGFHEGLDISAEKGTPILSVTAGRVEAVGWTFYSGTRVGVRGTDGRYYFYAHLSEVGPGIEAGAPVRAGAVLGRVGNTGYGNPGHEDEFPPHLHFGIQEGAGWVNPYPLVDRLYRGAVTVTRRVERRLERLAAQGRRRAYQSLVASVYADLAAP
jgi:murein DD-endopeptidase MepM/ murein hydrolase activator NlpD